MVLVFYVFCFFALFVFSIVFLCVNNNHACLCFLASTKAQCQRSTLHDFFLYTKKHPAHDQSTTVYIPIQFCPASVPLPASVLLPSRFRPLPSRFRPASVPLQCDRFRVCCHWSAAVHDTLHTPEQKLDMEHVETAFGCETTKRYQYFLAAVVVSRKDMILCLH